jgi:predicted AlkP superfamily phosphohydrolase/phosphomutase
MSIIILGLDGLDREMVERSKVSKLSEDRVLFERSLDSVVPPITVPAWACGFSGLRPDRLDCFDFQSLNLKEKEFVPVNPEGFNSEGYSNHTKRSSALFDVPCADRP